MKRTLIAALGFGVLLVAQGALAQIVFYEHEGLRGRVFSADRRIDNFEDYGFNDRASSAIVESGEWEVCDDAYFRGRCVTLRPGLIPLAKRERWRYDVSTREVWRMRMKFPSPWL